MERIGIIGIGNIGSRFAGQLLEAGYPLAVLDLDECKMAPAVARGAVPTKTPAEVAGKADMVLLCLPGSHAVETVMEGPQGLLSRLREGHLIVDTGTTHPDTDIRYEALCRSRAGGLLDAPITGRSKGFIMMVGGGAVDFGRAQPVLSLLSYKLAHIGPVGHGQLLKLANQLILAGQWAVFAEAVTWTQQAGIDPRLLKDYLEFPIDDRFYGDDFSGGGTLALHYKDLGYVLEIAHDNGASIPLTNVVHEAFKAAKNGGSPDWTQSGIVAYWRRLNRSGE